jgi:hypothetical protein
LKLKALHYHRRQEHFESQFSQYAFLRTIALGKRNELVQRRQQVDYPCPKNAVVINNKNYTSIPLSFHVPTFLFLGVASFPRATAYC